MAFTNRLIIIWSVQRYAKTRPLGIRLRQQADYAVTGNGPPKYRREQPGGTLSPASEPAVKTISRRLVTAPLRPPTCSYTLTPPASSILIFLCEQVFLGTEYSLPPRTLTLTRTRKSSPVPLLTVPWDTWSEHQFVRILSFFCRHCRSVFATVRLSRSRKGIRGRVAEVSE